MESEASSSSPPLDPDNPHHHQLFTPAQPLTDRILRALNHRLLLLHRSDSAFFVLGATGNVYTVNLSSSPSCTCPDRTTPCKHILFVLIRVLGVPLDDPCLWRRTLRPCQLRFLLNLPMSTEVIAADHIRQTFHQLFFQDGAWAPDNYSSPPRTAFEIKDGTSCPVCLEEMGSEDKVVACATCKNPIHEDCLIAWKRSSRRRSVSCVICRARWREGRSGVEQDKYLNLSAYVDENYQINDQLENVVLGNPEADDCAD